MTQRSTVIARRVNPKDVERKLLELAEQIIDDALVQRTDDPVPLGVKMEALKVAGSFLVSRKRALKGHDVEEDAPKGTFGTMRKQIENADTTVGEA